MANHSENHLAATSFLFTNAVFKTYNDLISVLDTQNVGSQPYRLSVHVLRCHTKQILFLSGHIFKICGTRNCKSRHNNQLQNKITKLNVFRGTLCKIMFLVGHDQHQPNVSISELKMC